MTRNEHKYNLRSSRNLTRKKNTKRCAFLAYALVGTTGSSNDGVYIEIYRHQNTMTRNEN